MNLPGEDLLALSVAEGEDHTRDSVAAGEDRIDTLVVVVAVGDVAAVFAVGRHTVVAAVGNDDMGLLQEGILGHSKGIVGESRRAWEIWD